jgi:hypothetical protein
MLLATSACCGAVVRNECRDHFSKSFYYEKWSLHLFLTTASQQADVASNILLFFYKKKRKQNKKIIKSY